MRTSRFSIFARACVIVFVIFMLIASAWNWATETRFWTPIEMAISAALTVVFFGGICWLIVNVAMGIFYGRNSGYQRYRRSGGDPYFDSLPSPLNPDSEITRETGLKEPEYGSFVPPAHWRFQCPRCGARVEHRIDVCRNCQYGDDGDSSDYYRRWGHLGKPDDVPDDRWNPRGGKHAS